MLLAAEPRIYFGASVAEMRESVRGVSRGGAKGYPVCALWARAGGGAGAGGGGRVQARDLRKLFGSWLD